MKKNKKRKKKFIKKKNLRKKPKEALIEPKQEKRVKKK